MTPDLEPEIHQVTGTIKLKGGETVQFMIDEYGGWHQWGNSDPHLGRAVVVTEAIRDAVREFIVEEEDEGDEPTPEPLDDGTAMESQYPRDIPDADGLDLPSYGD